MDLIKLRIFKWLVPAFQRDFDVLHKSYIAEKDKCIVAEAERDALQAENVRLRRIIELTYMDRVLSQNYPDDLRELLSENNVGSGDGVSETIMQWVNMQIANPDD